MLFNLQGEVSLCPGRADGNGMINLRQLIRGKFDVYHRPQDLHNGTLRAYTRCHIFLFSCLLSQRFGAGYNLEDLGCNTRLTGLVIRKVEIFEQFPGAIGRVLHGDHLR